MKPRLILNKILPFATAITILQLINKVSILVTTQRTSLDITFRDAYRPFRLLSSQLALQSGNGKQNLALVRSWGKIQKSMPRARSLVQFCDTQNGPGRRSDVRPTSVHRLRPGDIDIIGALGDSLTAGNGVFGTILMHNIVENRGVVFAIGGESNWRKYLTLPNILKEFNPNLYGYSLKDGLATDRSSKFNIAELGAMSRDVPYEATVLVKRMTRDPKVNMTHDWKMLTIFIGSNDFCFDICFYPNPELTIQWHEQNMLKTYRYLRDNVPRLIVNVLPAPNLRFVTRYTGLPAHCYTTLHFECPCLVGRSKAHVDYYENIMKKWIQKDYEIVSRDEFNTDTFTINIQPFTQFKDMPRTRDGNTDLSLVALDCFHLSQKGQAFCANALWNNLFEGPEEKSIFGFELFQKFRCPTEEHPYLRTRENNKPGFKV